MFRTTRPPEMIGKFNFKGLLSVLLSLFALLGYRAMEHNFSEDQEITEEQEEVFQEGQEAK